MAISDFTEKISGLDDAITDFARNMKPINQPPSIEAIANSTYSRLISENGKIWPTRE